MRTMFERVCRALATAQGFNQDLSWEDQAYLARAALEAMRDPTGSMLDAAAGAMCKDKRPTEEWVSNNKKHRIRYRAMIDKALAKPVRNPRAEDGKPEISQQHQA